MLEPPPSCPQALKSVTDSYHIICWWRSAACWASSTIMASSKNLLMLTSSLIPCRIQEKLKTLLLLGYSFLVLMIVEIASLLKLSVLYPQTNLHDFAASTLRSFSDYAINAAKSRAEDYLPRNFNVHHLNDEWQKAHIAYQSCWCTTWKEYHSPSLLCLCCVYIYIFRLVSYTHGVLKPQHQSTHTHESKM